MKNERDVKKKRQAEKEEVGEEGREETEKGDSRYRLQRMKNVPGTVSEALSATLITSHNNQVLLQVLFTEKERETQRA